MGLGGEFPISEKSEHHPTSGSGQIGRGRARVRPEVGAEVPEKDAPPPGAA